MTEFLYTIYQTPEYDEWFNEETFRSQSQILDRLDKIQEEGYFGNHKYLEGNIWELKFNDGRRSIMFILKNSKFFFYWEEIKMGKVKISPRRKTFIAKEKTIHKEEKDLPSINEMNMEGITEVRPREWLLNPNNIGKAIMECLMENDPEGVIEVISIYLRALNKEKFRQKADIGKSTYYYLMKSKNPTIKTLAKIVHSMVH